MSLRFRNGRWYVRVSTVLPDGTRFRKEVKSPAQTKKDALRFELEWRRALVDGSYFQKKVAPPLLKDFWPTYKSWTDNNTKPASAKAVEVAFRLHILPVLGGKRLDEVTAAEVEQLKGALLKAKKHPKTVNNVLGYLHRCLTLAIEHKKLDVAPGVGLLEYDEEEAEWLEPGEQQRLLSACALIDPARLPLLTVLLDGGLRIGEALALRWKDCDLSLGVLVVRRTRVAVSGGFGRPKEGASREVHLTDRIVATLKAHRHLRGELVFTASEGQPLTHSMVKDWVSDAAKRAGISKAVTNHSLRHSRTALLCMAGVDERTIMAELGWATPDMVRKYAHLSPSHRRDAVTKVESFLSGAKKKTEES